MQDKVKFMELLTEVAEIAKAQDNIITQDEIKKYFNDMELEENQFDHIYTYLSENQIKVQGFLYKSKTPVSVVEEENQVTEAATSKEDSAYLKMYLEDITSIQPLVPGEEIDLIQKTLNGDDTAKLRLMEGNLHAVVELAHEYKNKGVLIEDLIQEGNMGLIRGIDSLADLSKLEEGNQFLSEYIRQSMEQAIDEEMDASDWESTVIAKTALIHEAAKYLAEDMGRVATVQELSDYTKLTIEEITDILNLSLDAVKTADHDHHHHGHEHHHDHKHNHHGQHDHH